MDENLNEDAKSYEEKDQMMHYEDTSLFEDIAHQGTAEGKCDENVVVEEENVIADVQGDDIQSTGDQIIAQSTGVQSTLDQGTATLNFDEIGPSTRTLDEEAGPSNPIQQEEIKEHTASDDETIAQIMLNILRPTGISIPGVEQSQVSQSSSQSTEELNPKDKGKGIMKVSKKKKKKFTLA